MSDYGYDYSYSTDLSNLSNDYWGQSLDLQTWANDVWADQGYSDLYYAIDNYSDASATYSNDLYQASWDAWYGPVNTEGYTAYDASIGYTTTDTSYIEPASYASTTSLISDYDTTSTL